jgi:hypothetical protein
MTGGMEGYRNLTEDERLTVGLIAYVDACSQTTF